MPKGHFRNDKFFCDSSENTAKEEESYEYDDYPDKYWESEIHDVTDEAAGEHDDKNMVL